MRLAFDHQPGGCQIGQGFTKRQDVTSQEHVLSTTHRRKIRMGEPTKQVAPLSDEHEQSGLCDRIEESNASRPTIPLTENQEVWSIPRKWQRDKHVHGLQATVP
jgi:hypothetical protein